MFWLKIVLVFVLTTTLSDGLLIKNCPSKEEMKVCTCEKEYVSDLFVNCYYMYQGNAERKADVRRDMNKLMNYEIDEFKLESAVSEESLPADFFHGMTITVVRVINSNISFASGRPPFDGLQRTLKDIYVRSSEIGFSKMSLKHLENLQGIYISYINIPVVQEEMIRRWPRNITFLQMDSCSIKEVESYAFRSLTKLRILSLSSNVITNFERSMLADNLTDLFILDLSSNRLTRLDIDFFQGMPNLRAVHLRLNRFTFMDWRTWQPVWNRLKFVYISGNPFDCIYTQWICPVSKPERLVGSCSYHDNTNDVQLGSEEHCSHTEE